MKDEEEEDDEEDDDDDDDDDDDSGVTSGTALFPRVAGWLYDVREVPLPPRPPPPPTWSDTLFISD